MPDRIDTHELDAAIAAISDPQRLRAAQDLIARVAPALGEVLSSAIRDGGWFDTAHGAALREAVALSDPQERLRVIDSLLADEARLAMLVGAAVGFELARELDYARNLTGDKESL